MELRSGLLCAQRMLDKLCFFDFLAPLALRLFLVPIFWTAGMNKWNNMQSTIEWFANPDWGLGLPMPTLLAYLATFTEIIGAVCLLIGLAVRWISIPLMMVMVVAAFAVHWDNGWLAIAHSTSEASQRLAGFLQWLKSNFPQRHGFITELGKPVILNNGIEFAVTYFIMLLSLFFTGAGKYVSVDYWVDKFIKR